MALHHSAQCLRAQLTQPTISLSRNFTTTVSALSRAPLGFKKRRHDPYTLEQARARKAANLSRRAVLEKERAEQLGDPIRGSETDFLKSFDNPPNSDIASATDGSHLNFFVNAAEIESNIERSKWLMTPGNEIVGGDEIAAQMQKTRLEKLATDHANAAEAIKRISSLSLGNSKDRLRVNVQRCIDTFGRHNTDATLPRLSRSADTDITAEPRTSLRAGPDTGSSEVQIAILTAKIRTLTQFLEGRGRQDKHNRRNLTLLVHRRQKLLQYLRRKERGGPRWQNLIQTLGLTEGTWKGEITLPRYI